MASWGIRGWPGSQGRFVGLVQTQMPNGLWIASISVDMDIEVVGGAIEVEGLIVAGGGGGGNGQSASWEGGGGGGGGVVPFGTIVQPGIYPVVIGSGEHPTPREVIRRCSASSLSAADEAGGRQRRWMGGPAAEGCRQRAVAASADKETPVGQARETPVVAVAEPEVLAGMRRLTSAATEAMGC